MYLRTECFCCMPTTTILSGKVDLLEKLLDNFPKKKEKKYLYISTLKKIKNGQVTTCPYNLKKRLRMQKFSEAFGLAQMTMEQAPLLPLKKISNAV